MITKTESRHKNTFLAKSITEIKNTGNSKFDFILKDELEKYPTLLPHLCEQMASGDAERVSDALQSFSIIAPSLGANIENFEGNEILVATTLEAYSSDDMSLHVPASVILNALFEFCPNISANILSQNSTLVDLIISKVPEPETVKILTNLYINVPGCNEYLKSNNIHAILLQFLPKYFRIRPIISQIIDFFIKTNEDLSLDAECVSVIVDLIKPNETNSVELLKYLDECFSEVVANVVVSKGLLGEFMVNHPKDMRNSLYAPFTNFLLKFMDFESEDINGLEIIGTLNPADFIACMVAYCDKEKEGLVLALELIRRGMQLISEEFFFSLNAVYYNSESTSSHTIIELYNEIVVRMLLFGVKEIFDGLEPLDPLFCIDDALSNQKQSLLCPALQVSALLIRTKEGLPDYYKEWVESKEDDSDFIENLEELSLHKNEEIADSANEVITILNTE